MLISKKIFPLSCLIVFIYNFTLSNTYPVVLAEENNPISDMTLNGIGENLNSRYRFTWGNVQCSYDSFSNDLFIGGGEITEEEMVETPFNNGAQFPFMPDEIQSVYFEEKIKFNGSAEDFFIQCTELTLLEGLDNIDTSAVTDMSSMFKGLVLHETPIIDISNWDTSNVTTMDDMFAYVGNDQFPTEIILNMESENNNLNSIDGMFRATTFASTCDIGTTFQNFDTSKVKSMKKLFDSSNNIGVLDLSGASMDNIISCQSMFNMADISELLLPETKPESLLEMDSMFLGLQTESLYGLEHWNTSDVVSMEYLFFNSKLKNPPIQNFDIGSVTNAAYMFARMSELELLNFGKDFNTEKITTMEGMFSNITYKDLDLSFFDTSSVTNIDSMFINSKIDSLNLSGWNNPKLKSMDSTFSGGSLYLGRGYINEINLTDFNTSTVEDMSFLFFNTENIGNFDFSSLEVSSVTSMEGMFRASSFEEFDFSTWDTSNVTDMSQMFSGDVGRDRDPVPMNITKLDLSELNTDSLNDSYRMFANLDGLEEINLASFHTLDEIDTEDMFVNCTNLAKIELSKNSNTFPKDTNLPEIDSSSKYPTSWLSEKSDIFFENTPDFISQYEYTLNDGSNEVMIRSFKYIVEYAVEDNIICSEEYLYNQLVEIPNYFNNRYEISTWVDLESETTYTPYTEVANIGVTKTSFGKQVHLKGSYGEREVNLNMHWKNSATDRLETSMDIGESKLSQSIIIRPELEFDHPPTEIDKNISYRINTYDTSNQQKSLIQTSIAQFEINNSTEWLYELIIDSFSEGISSIELEFYQLSVIGENDPIKESPSGKLSILLTKDSSFSIVEHTEALLWDIKQKDSKGILERSEDNDLSFLILNSLYPDSQWDISLSMDFPDNLPFKFIWKDNETSDGIIIDKNTPMLLLNKEEAGSVSGYKYRKTWSSDTGLLIQSDSILPSNSYGKDVSVTWILTSSPDFK